MKLSDWAKNNGLTYQTAWNLYKNGNLPVKAYQLKTGTILVEENIREQESIKIVIYGRVSNRDRKQSLEDQIERCKIYCNAKGYNIHKIYKEIASGMNDKRKQLLLMLENEPNIIVVENKDRLTRFGFNYLNLLLNKLNCKIEVINCDDNDETDLMRDLISIITSFCCRVYGLRRGYNKSVKIKEEILN